VGPLAAFAVRFLPSRRLGERVRTLEARVAHLESMIEGLQDAVHRNSVRIDAQVEELQKQLAPGQLSRTLSAEQRKRGT
jgi:uncharacterized coiled-coil protein SlyX